MHVGCARHVLLHQSITWMQWLHAQAQKEQKEDKAAADRVQQELSTLKALKEKKAQADRQYAPHPRC